MTLGIRYWLPLAFVITALSGLIYLTGQQNLRQGANDPQIQTSEDIAARLSENPAIPSAPSSAIVDISKSLSPYIIIYSDKGQPVYSTAKLDGQTPTLPAGVLDYTREHKQNRLTWQPKPGVRSATVITKYNSSKGSGFVLVGRSMREVEEREEQLQKSVVLAWIVIMAGSFIAKIIFIPKQNKKK